MDKEKIRRIYNRIVDAVAVEPCTYREVLWAINKFRSRFFEQKASDFLNNTDFQKIADHEVDHK